jgi:hypothetical protein
MYAISARNLFVRTAAGRATLASKHSNVVFAALLAAHVGVWTLFASISSLNLDVQADMVENIVWAQTPKPPPPRHIEPKLHFSADFVADADGTLPFDSPVLTCLCNCAMSSFANLGSH